MPCSSSPALDDKKAKTVASIHHSTKHPAVESVYISKKTTVTQCCLIIVVNLLLLFYAASVFSLAQIL